MDHVRCWTGLVMNASKFVEQRATFEKESGDPRSIEEDHNFVVLKISHDPRKVPSAVFRTYTSAGNTHKGECATDGTYDDTDCQHLQAHRRSHAANQRSFPACPRPSHQLRWCAFFTILTA